MSYRLAGWVLALFLVLPGALLAAPQRLAGMNIFVKEDRDSFDRGIAVGEPFPRIRAFYKGRIVTDLMEFSGEAGLVVVTNRSADW